MLILAKILGVIIVGMGTVVMLNPGVFKRMTSFWREGRRIYIAGVLRFLFGILFLSIASNCKIPVIMFILGILMLIGGILVFAIGPERIKRILDWWDSKPPSILRLAGIMALSIGALIIYSI